MQSSCFRTNVPSLTLEEDEQAAVAFANKLAWPPIPTDECPFWKME